MKLRVVKTGYLVDVTLRAERLKALLLKVHKHTHTPDIYYAGMHTEKVYLIFPFVLSS